MGNCCLNCSIAIPAKTKSGKTRTFCGKSCARKYTCRTKPEVVSAANKKGYQTLKAENPEVIKHRGRSTERKRANNGGGLFPANANRGEWSAKHQKARKQTMIENGQFLNPEVFDHSEFKRYQQAAHRMTKKLYGSAGQGFHWDHIVPVKTAFELGITIAQLSAKENIRKISAVENLSKGSKLTDEAKTLIKEWAA